MTAVALSTGFDPRGRYQLSPRVGLRPEPFGALAYHFDTRRLVFLKAPELVQLVRALADHPSVDAAIEAVIDPPPARRRSYVTALAALHEAGVVQASVEPSP